MTITSVTIWRPRLPVVLKPVAVPAPWKPVKLRPFVYRLDAFGIALAASRVSEPNTRNEFVAGLNELSATTVPPPAPGATTANCWSSYGVQMQPTTNGLPSGAVAGTSEAFAH